MEESHLCSELLLLKKKKKKILALQELITTLLMSLYQSHLKKMSGLPQEKQSP